MEATGLRQPVVVSTAIKRGFEAKLPGATLVILDTEAGHLDPLYWIKQIHNSCPGAAVMLVAPSNDPNLASRALRAGANAYIASDLFDAQFQSALNLISMGERYVSEDVMQGILHGIVQTSSAESHVPVESLSDREMMVFQLLGEGKVIRTIADELGVNIKTVATHCNNIRRKLSTTDNRQLSELSRDWVAGRESGKEQSHHSSTSHGEYPL